jgi:ketosteroid isomerase-like protein
MNRVLSAGSLSVLVLALACAEAPPPPPARDAAADEAALREATTTFLTAFNAGDLAGMQANVADDIVQMPEDGPDIVGKAAIAAGDSQFIASAKMQQAATVDEVAVWGDMAMTRGSWEITATPNDGKGAPTVTRGKWLVLHKRAADGSWQSWRHIWNRDAAPTTK